MIFQPVQNIIDVKRCSKLAKYSTKSLKIPQLSPMLSCQIFTGCFKRLKCIYFASESKLHILTSLLTLYLLLNHSEITNCKCQLEDVPSFKNIINLST